MISEDKILRYYEEAVNEQHPDPDRAVFGRLGITEGDESYDKDGAIGVFGVSEALAKTIGMDIVGNTDASFKAMMHFDLQLISESTDVGIGMAKTAGAKDTEKYIKQMDASVADYQEKVEWEAGRPVRFKTDVSTPNTSSENPLGDADGVSEVMSKSKEITASYAKESEKNASMGVEVDAKQEYDRLVDLLKGAIGKMTPQ